MLWATRMTESRSCSSDFIEHTAQRGPGARASTVLLEGDSHSQRPHTVPQRSGCQEGQQRPQRAGAGVSYFHWTLCASNFSLRKPTCHCRLYHSALNNGDRTKVSLCWTLVCHPWGGTDGALPNTCMFQITTDYQDSWKDPSVGQGSVESVSQWVCALERRQGEHYSSLISPMSPQGGLWTSHGRISATERKVRPMRNRASFCHQLGSCISCLCGAIRSTLKHSVLEKWAHTSTHAGPLCKSSHGSSRTNWRVVKSMWCDSSKATGCITTTDT